MLALESANEKAEAAREFKEAAAQIAQTFRQKAKIGAVKKASIALQTLERCSNQNGDVKKCNNSQTSPVLLEKGRKLARNESLKVMSLPEVNMADLRDVKVWVRLKRFLGCASKYLTHRYLNWPF